MAKYRIDQFFDELKAFLIADLNTAIAAMNTEKGDTLLKTVDPDAYVFQDITTKVANFNPFIFYGIDGTSSAGQLGATIKTYLIDVIIIKSTSMNTSTDDDLDRRTILRYGEVLAELFETNFSKIHTSHTLKVNSLEPISFKALGRSEPFRAVGVQLELNLT